MDQTSHRNRRKRWFIASLALSFPIICCVLLLLLNGVSGGIYAGIRASALLAYLYSFESILASALIKPLVKLYRKPFIKLHHAVAVTALVMMVSHGGLYAIYDRSWLALLPLTSSWAVFWQTAGRPALWLFIIAAAAARFRQQFKDGWKMVHALTFVAFAFATIHAVLIGTDTFLAGIRVIMWALLAAAAAVAIVRRASASK